MNERDRERERDPRGAATRGYLAEGVRLLFIALLATGGFLVGGAVAAGSTGRALTFIFLGAAVGFVIGGVVGRLTLRAVSGMER
ncbi:MAG: hypothetical protein ACRDGK_05435, partial [Actinomycetota bacterium]